MRPPARRALRVTAAALAASAVVAFVAAARELRDAVPAPTAADVPYGPDPRQRLDFWMADTADPAPLLVFIHGGGFVVGGKHEIDGRVIRWAREAGISVAAINYRFVTTDPFPAPMLDAARAVQFLRSRASAWNLDPERFAAYGGSAGAGLALWLGLHDDLARPDSPDPVERQSTRLVAVGAWAGQTTYDPTVIRAWLGGRAWEHPSLLKLFGLASTAEVDNPCHAAAFNEASPIAHLSADDPPVYLLYNEPDAPLPSGGKPGRGIHHPEFGHRLARAMQSLGLESVYVHKDDPSDGNSSRSMFEFLQRHLQW